MKNYVVKDVDTLCERTIKAHSILEAVWVLFGPCAITGTLNTLSADVYCGSGHWEVQEERR